MLSAWDSEAKNIACGSSWFNVEKVKQTITLQCDKCYRSGKQGMLWDCRRDTRRTPEPIFLRRNRRTGRAFQAEGAILYIDLNDSWFVPKVKKKNMRVRYEA